MMNKLFTRTITLMGLVVALTLMIYSGVSASSTVTFDTDEQCNSVDANGIATNDCDDDDDCEERTGIYSVLTDDPCDTGNTLAAPTGLTIVGDLNALPLAVTFTWKHQINNTDTEVPGDWYQLVIVERRGNREAARVDPSARYGGIIISQWFDADIVCDGVYCAVGVTRDLNPYLAGDFLNGNYLWLVRSWTGPLPGTFSAWSDESEFSVEIPTPDVGEGITVTEVNGRPVIIIPHTKRISWAQVAIVGTTEAGDPYFHLFWYKLNRRNCTQTYCLIYPFAFPVNGSYQAWLQLWGPGGFGKGHGDYPEWYGPYAFTINLDAPDLPGGLTHTHGGLPGHHHFHWHKLPRAAWFNIWIGTTDFSETAFYGWVEALELDCDDDGECSFELPDGITLNPNKSYTWYIQAWGPGGFSHGGEGGWKHGGDFNPGG